MKKIKKSPAQLELEREYKRIQRNLKASIKRREKKGFIIDEKFKESVAFTPKKITKGSVNRLKKITPKKIDRVVSLPVKFQSKGSVTLKGLDAIDFRKWESWKESGKKKTKSIEAIEKRFSRKRGANKLDLEVEYTPIDQSDNKQKEQGQEVSLDIEGGIYKAAVEALLDKLQKACDGMPSLAFVMQNIAELCATNGYKWFDEQFSRYGIYEVNVEYGYNFEKGTPAYFLYNFPEWSMVAKQANLFHGHVFQACFNEFNAFEQRNGKPHIIPTK